MVKEHVLLQMKLDLTFYVIKVWLSSPERCVYCVVLEKVSEWENWWKYE